MFDRVENEPGLSGMDVLEPQSIPEHVLFGRSRVMQEIRQAVQKTSQTHRRSRWPMAPTHAKRSLTGKILVPLHLSMKRQESAR